jgi:hypothetical protein
VNQRSIFYFSFDRKEKIVDLLRPTGRKKFMLPVHRNEAMAIVSAISNFFMNVAVLFFELSIEIK